LVEEIGQQQSFYDLLQIPQSAKVSEVRRAYRKLSLVLHPDKNESPDAEIKFRQLVAVYEVLKDEEKRKKYDQVLRDGLPDWRQPIYYYRKVKKMGLMELAILLSVITTFGHYIVSWAIYLEKVFEMEEVLAPLKKRREKKRAKGKALADDIDITPTTDLLEKNYGYKKPEFKDLLPFVIYRFAKSTILGIPQNIHDLKLKYEEFKEQKRLEEERAKELENIEVKEKVRPKKKPPVKLRDASEIESNLPVMKAPHLASSSTTEESSKSETRANTEWTEDDVSALAKAMAKFPGGTPGRWDRIAIDIGRTVAEVTKKVKELKTSLSETGSVTAAVNQTQPLSGKRSAFQISDDIISKAIEVELKPNPIITVTPNDLYMTQDDIPDDYDQGVSNNEDEDSDVEQYRRVRKRKVKTRKENTEDQPPTESKEESNTNEEGPQKNSTSEPNDSTKENEKPVDIWTQVQQKCLENALAQIPKSRTERWTHIARAVPGKTKEECIQRYKALVEHIKKKKELENPIIKTVKKE